MVMRQPTRSFIGPTPTTRLERSKSAERGKRDSRRGGIGSRDCGDVSYRTSEARSHRVRADAPHSK